MRVSLALRRHQQEDCKLEASWNHMVRVYEAMNTLQEDKEVSNLTLLPQVKRGTSSIPGACWEL